MEMPSFDEMVKKLNGDEGGDECENLSTDQKIDEIFKILKEAQCSEHREHQGGEDVEGLMKMGGMPPGVMQDSTYNSSTSTYDGQQPTAQYNGGSL